MNLLASPLRQLLILAAIALAGLSFGAASAGAAGEERISHAAESIHQEVLFEASPARVYEALTRTDEFSGVMRLSAAVKSGMALGTKATSISGDVGGAFTLYGGHILGRQIELVPNERIVQAWRAAGWDAGVYSIARFELSAQGAGTRLVFDHTGFPEGQAAHLAEGWRTNYWEPLAKFLASSGSSAAGQAKP
ncbi:MAG: SRPBCC domain-containing protein [Acidobacteria bacterium]|nr:SRPBCC domain-containing protein [Acidobacteriota bacterium]